MLYPFAMEKFKNPVLPLNYPGSHDVILMSILLCLCGDCVCPHMCIQY